MVICTHAKCKKDASYGHPGTKSGIFCKPHAENGMVDIRNKRCIYPSCSHQPSFGLATDKKPTLCRQHAQEGMVDIRSKRCIYPSCSHQPSFGLATDKKPTLCRQHAQEGMVDIRSKRCIYPSCSHQPSFGLVTDSTATVCSQHKDYLPSDQDVRNFVLRCDLRGCQKLAKYGQAGARPTRCQQHGLPDNGYILLVRKAQSSAPSSCSRRTSRDTTAADGSLVKRAREAIPRVPGLQSTAASAMATGGKTLVAVVDDVPKRKKKKQIIWI